MAQIVKLRRSSVSGQKPTNSNLQLGELALNTTDGKVYMAKSGSLGPTVEELISTNTVNTGSIHLVGDITASIFTGSFTGDGTNLYNIPASGVTGLNLTRIADGNATASISNSDGLKINTNSEITGSLIVTDNVTASLFTGSFKGDGSQLYNIPASGVTGLNLTRIADGNATASISNSQGLKINTNTEITGSLIVSSGSAVFDASLQLTENSSLILNSGSNLYVYDGGIISGTFKGNGALLTDLPYATTASNHFFGDQVITGSVTITQNLTVLGSSSIVYTTASQLIVEDNKIILNASYPAERFAGIEVHDSGSNGSVTASLFWDGQNNRWIYQNSSEAHYGGAMFIAGPRNTGSLGDEQTLTNGRIPKSIGGDHIGDSIISETGSTITVSGSLIANSITGSLSGDATGLTNVPFHITGSDVDGNTYDKQFSKLQFDDSTGLNVSESVAGTAFISIGSHFRDIFVSGSTMLRATGSDAFEIIPQGGIEITTSVTDTNGNGYIKELNISTTNLSSSLNDRMDIITGSVDSLNTFSSSVVLTSETASMTVLSASYAVTAAFALNAGGGGEGKTYIHNQTSASTTWTVTHNLGERYPSIEVFDSNGYVVIPGDILAQNDNTLVVTFPSAQSGKVSVTVGGGLPYISGSYVEYVLATDGDSPRWKGGIISGSQQITNFGFATTGSNIFYGNQTISGTTTIGVATMGSKCVTISSNTAIFDLGTFDGANFDYVVKNGNNMRAGLIMSAWNGTNSVYNESSTMDLGSTTDVTFSVSSEGVLNANISSGTWAVEVLYRALGCSEITPPTPTSTPTPTPTVTSTPTPTPTPTPTSTGCTVGMLINIYGGSDVTDVCSNVMTPSNNPYVCLNFNENSFDIGRVWYTSINLTTPYPAGYYKDYYDPTWVRLDSSGTIVETGECVTTSYQISSGSTAPDYCSGLFGQSQTVYGNASDWLEITRFYTSSGFAAPFNGNNKYYGNSTADYGTTLQIDESGYVINSYAC